MGPIKVSSNYNIETRKSGLRQS